MGIMEKTEATISIGIMEKKMEAEPKSSFPKRGLGLGPPIKGPQYKPQCTIIFL